MFYKIVAMFVVGFTMSTLAGTATENLDVFRGVQQQVLGYTQFTIFDSVQAKVNDGVVTLTGKVTMPYKREDIGRLVEKANGVRDVRNHIDVLPVSHCDDELRFRISRAIYRNSNFWTYATMTRPPIHVIVERGRVTPEGVVNNEVERVLARAIAGSFDAFSITNNLKTDAEMREELEKL
jgi:osmotically-inducible protein OsmY